MAPPKKQKVANKSQARQNPPKQTTTGTTTSTQEISETQQTAPFPLQQSILDVFCRAFHSNQLSIDEINASIQKVKGHLFLREFSHAFAKQEYLDAYALRWSASRALGYLDILLHGDLQDFWLGEISSRPDNNHAADDGPPPTKSDSGACRVACIGGGGGAEVVVPVVVCFGGFCRACDLLATFIFTQIEIQSWQSDSIRISRSSSSMRLG